MTEARKSNALGLRVVRDRLGPLKQSVPEAANLREGIDQISPKPGAFRCLPVPFQGFEATNPYLGMKWNFALYILSLRGYTRRRRRGRVVEGAPLLRE